jgi:glycine/D-amino acid oxidase-like deaminating enzyme
MSTQMAPVDVAIVGAGIMGASTAYWLKRLQPQLSVVLIERDRTFARASSALSASSIRQQFSSPVNIRMSLFGAQFLRETGIAFNESGYLYLGSRSALEKLNAVQQQCGADIALLGPDELAARFPWLNISDIEAGSLGLSGEGWFDGAALHITLLLGARSAGAKVIDGEALGFSIRNDSVQTIDLADGSRVACRHAVDAAGPWARPLAARAGVELPVHARRRTVFVLSCPAPLQDCPLVIDPTGFWFRPDGEVFIAGDEPAQDEDDLPLEPDLAAFDEALWARMAHRVPAFEALRVERAWAGYYEMNLFDHNAIVGPHPKVSNLWFINGFSGHGMQHAPAAGRGLAELIVSGRYETLDLSPLRFERVLEGTPLVEANIIG